MKHNDIKTWTAQQDWSQGYAAVAKASGISYFAAAKRAKLAGVEVKLMKRGRKLGTPNDAARKIPSDLRLTSRNEARIWRVSWA